MAEPSIVVRCPHCGHPYPMTELQREVYRGRTMGCVNCGRPIHVDAAIAAQFPAAAVGADFGPGGAVAGAAAGVMGSRCGWLGRVRARGPLGGGRSAATCGLGLGAVGLLVGGCVMSTIVPNLHRARERADREACEGNRQQIATAIGSYAS